MSIVTLPLPYQFFDGMVADAAPVMGNLNYIANQVNANGPSGGATITHINVNVPAVSLVTTTLIPLGTAAQTAVKSLDTLNEFNLTTGHFVPTVAGVYAMSVGGYALDAGATWVTAAGFRIALNGAQPNSWGDGNTVAAPTGVNGVVSIPTAMVMVQVGVGDVVTFNVYSGIFGVAGVSLNRANIIVNRIY
jgi:hypothetical protein